MIKFANIRVASTSDSSVVRKIIKETPKNGIVPELSDHVLPIPWEYEEADHLVLLANDEFGCVGFLAVRITSDSTGAEVGEISRIDVLPISQRKGHGSALLDYAEILLGSIDVHRMAIFIPKGNSRVREFLMNRGFKTNGEYRINGNIRDEDLELEYHKIL